MKKSRKSKTKLDSVTDENMKDWTCRIWLDGESNDVKDPLISPCLWSGTMKYIHLKWLTSWLDSKKVVESGPFFKFIFWKATFCELCKENFKPSIYMKGKKIELLKYEVPKNSHHLVLEAVNTEESLRKLYIWDFRHLDNLILGRGNESQVKISDISISRVHANIRIMNSKEMWLEDNNSKFGSLILQEDPIEFTSKTPITYLQVGRSFLTVSWQYPSSCWCFKSVAATKGFSAYTYFDGFPLSIRQMLFPEVARSNAKDSFDGNHDFLENSEYNTNYNILENNGMGMKNKPP